MESKKHTGTIIIVIVFIVLLILLSIIFIKPKAPAPISISNFNECVQSGFAILESYPRRCKTPNGQTFSEDVGNVVEKIGLIRVESHKPNDILKTNPVHLYGQARGYWFFEGTLPVEVKDNNGLIIGSGVATARPINDDGWMTTEFVPFDAVIRLTQYPPATEKGLLVFKKDNPSGIPENEDDLHMPIIFPNKNEIDAVNIYFGYGKESAEDCESVIPTERGVVVGQAPIKTTLLLLLAGPAQDEKDRGFYTSIPNGVKIQALSLKDGILSVDFDKTLETGIAGSCMVTQIRSQIIKTLLQFPAITDVNISIDGRTEDILQP